MKNQKIILYKCNKNNGCQGGTESINLSINESISFCHHLENPNCKHRTPMIVRKRNFQCWFMRDNHAYVKCTGNLQDIKRQLIKLFKIDKAGGWGDLKYEDEDENNYIIKGLEYNLDKLDKLIEEDYK